MNASSVYLTLFALPALAGCAGQPPSDRFGIATQPVYIVHSLERPLKVVAREAPVPRGRLVITDPRLARRLDLTDPITYGKDRVAAALRRDLGATGVQVVAEPVAELGSDNLQKFKEEHPHGVLFQIRTEYWGIDADRRTRYVAKAWLISLDNPGKRWAVVCTAPQIDLADKKEGPSEIPHADQGPDLNAIFRKSAEACGDYIARQVMGLTS